SLNSSVYTDAIVPTGTTIVKARSFVNGVPFSRVACEVFRIWGTSSGCVSPTGLVSWWSGDCNTAELIGGNDGALQGNTSYQSGEVGAAFNFDGTSSAVVVKNAPNLQLQTFAIEGWIQRTSATQATLSGYQNGTFFAFG